MPHPHLQHLDEPLPSGQYHFDGLATLSERILHRRREFVFLVLAGLFLGTLAMLNILGITRFIVIASISDGTGLSWGQWGEISFAVAVGVLPYPVTFLCTDFISELYGRRRANQVVMVGLLLNVWVMSILWLGGALPGSGGVDPELLQSMNTAVESLPISEGVEADTVEALRSAVAREPVFFEVRTLAFGAVMASMIAYLIAQLVDVQVFHFWKRLTRGKHLWIRNNGSTLVSQLVDTIAVILITHFYARALPMNEGAAVWPQLLIFIGTGYVFKLVAALLDTPVFIIGTKHLVRYLRLTPPGVEKAQRQCNSV
jgi:uncharacterized PurR-regulated membrane protein YhhQ (DUF165 family)